MTTTRVRALAAGTLVAMLGATAPARGPGAPADENTILVEEIPHIAERSVMLSLPPSPDAALEALQTYPGQADEVIGMRARPVPPDALRVHAGRRPAGQPAAGWRRLLTIRATAEEGRGHLRRRGGVHVLGRRDHRDRHPAHRAVESDPQATRCRAPRRPERRHLRGQRPRAHGRAVHGGRGDPRDPLRHDASSSSTPTRTVHREDRHQFWSMTKSVTTALVGIAVEDGLVTRSRPIETYIPEAAGTVREDTTVEDLLQMESGSTGSTSRSTSPRSGADGRRLHTNGLYGMTRDEYLLQLTRVSTAGEHYRYNSADAQCRVAARDVYDDSYSTILSEKLWQRAGMEDDALIMVDREGDAFASMGLFATAKDAVRFGELFRNGGRNLDGEQVVPEEWVEASWDHSEETGGPRATCGPSGPDGSFAAGYGDQTTASPWTWTWSACGSATTRPRRPPRRSGRRCTWRSPTRSGGRGWRQAREEEGQEGQGTGTGNGGRHEHRPRPRRPPLRMARLREPHRSSSWMTRAPARSTRPSRRARPRPRPRSSPPVGPSWRRRPPAPPHFGSSSRPCSWRVWHWQPRGGCGHRRARRR